MKLPGRAEWVFSIRTFAAAVLALFIGLYFALDRPYWAMASAYIASQPLSGATRSKAVYRLLGTVLGASAAVALVPNLVDAPVLLTLAMSAWTGTCLYFALLDRTPRSYVFMLAGYTAAIVGFPSVAAPDAIFLTAAARVQEIGLGILCASLMASVVFPRRVQPVVSARLEKWLGNADRLSLAALDAARDDEAVRLERQRLAGDLAEIDMLTSYLAWDPAVQPDALRSLRALRRRLLMLLPVLSSLADRVRGLRDAGGLSRVEGELRLAADWVGSRQTRAPAGLRGATEFGLSPGAVWAELLRTSLLERLRELIDLTEDCRRLLRHLTEGGPFPAPLAYARSMAAADVRERDHGRALWSAASAALAVSIVCLFWIESAWADGAVAAEMTAVACCFFAAMDDPVPAILGFLTWSAVAAAVDAVYLFGVLPAATDFPSLVLALAPAYLLFGAITALPETYSIGMALTANGATLLSLQSTYNAQFDSFVNSAVALVAGMGAAAVITAIVRSVGAEWSALRLLRRGWKELAEAAERRGQGDRAEFAGLMLDRIGLVAPRIAAAERGSELRAVDVLADVRVGLNIVALRRVRRGLPAEMRARVETVLAGLAAHYRARRTGGPAAGSEELLRQVDGALAEAARAGRPGPLHPLVGIRRGLFPAAPPYTPPPPDAPPMQAAA